ncbi:OLC1v1021396C2 [Oldenlandia corymbosa var. corymbosa]|uniref:OLC1v1021396C2 n=1 Tax=Oldenlandia corymbosa var. corymbosa TaxID=529605 RepID=A0AAV1BXU5_OLDCO|nr:OLC1v1021396C2 [Oldenlandia corymbosa var. corymbosa]
MGFMGKILLHIQLQHNSKFFSLFLLFLFLPSLLLLRAKGQPMYDNTVAPRNSVSAIFVFGDSTSDTGNNNYVSTTFKSNFPPYGRDFFNHIPTGRFTNGRLASDFIAKYVGIKEFVPPYLDPSIRNEDLITGVSFASAGSGFDPLTPTLSNVISLSKQLEYFKVYQTKVAALIGEDQTQALIRNSLFLVSAGTNDFVVNYFAVPIRRDNYTIAAYIDFCLGYVDQFMQGLWDLGARRIGVVGLPPMGCLPIVMTLYSGSVIGKRNCLNSYSDIARNYNQKLQNQLGNMQTRFADNGSRIAYLDAYSPLEAMMSHAQDYGFDEVSSGCCGTGYLEASYLCNPRSYICPDASKYVFWDSIHPTEKTYYLLSQNVRPVIDSLVQD